ncbi:MAG: response regulator [Spirochaetales bacterium]|nr:response regulator [Spirochaetales bacterium]
MSVSKFELNDDTLSIIEEIGGHMPGGFFIYESKEPERILYANKEVFNIFGCTDLEEFRNLTGYTFRGMVHPEDYSSISESIGKQIGSSDDNMDYVEYRIVRKDGSVRWVDDYGHYAETKNYGGVYVVFISDITEKREKREDAAASREAVISTLINTYNTVLLINDAATEKCSLYHTDRDSEDAEAINNALRHSRYTDIIEGYVSTRVAEEDRERMLRKLGLSYMLEQLETKKQFSVNFVRAFNSGNRYYRVVIGKVNMPGGKLGIMMGFKDVDDEVRQDRALQEALKEGKRAEEENRRLISEVQSAAKLAELMGSASSLLSNMPAMSFSKDAETRVYLACNQAFAEYAGKKTPDAVIGLTDHELFDKETADHFFEDDTKAIDMEGAYVFFEDVPDGKGTSMRNLQTTKLKFRDLSGRLCILGMCVDITEMTRIKTAEAEAHAKQQELEEKLALQEQLIQQEQRQKELDSMITAMASDYRSVYHVDIDANDAVCYRADPNDPEQVREGVHFAYHETFSEYCAKHVDPEFQEGFMHFIEPDNVRAVLATENIMAYRYLANRNGTDYYEMLRMAGVRHPSDRDDHIVHAVGVGFTVIDAEMRETMARNHALKDALAAAEDANKAKTAFLSNMSHEVRTPMNAIIGLNNIAMNEPTASEKVKEYLAKIDSSAHHLLGIINDILDMSRIESERMVIKKEEFSFAKVMEQVNTMISGQCRDKGLTYNCNIRGHVDDYYIGDDVKLKQALINILGNAVKFTPEGGAVSFIIEEVSRFDGKSTLRFTVRDTGIGMSREFLPRLFDPFSLEDSSSTSKYGSTGLGMPITKSIVELMNGNIEVESEKGKGTTFNVTVTLLESERSALDGANRGEGVPQPHEMCVLVIDDDPIACEHAQIILGQLGISCEKALTGHEGVEMVKLRHARREPYTLLLVDWKMPDIDGVETTRQIRAAVGDEIPIIIMTSYSWEEIVDEARSAGVDTFVSKPLFAGTVMDEFRAAFKRKNVKLERQTADLRGRRILLAEDMTVNAEIMMMVLSMREIEVVLAENGELAVKKFSESEIGYFDAILMDMRMPVMDGLEATRTIRALDRPDARSVPIIALTANAFDEDVQRSMQAGLNAHLSKPVEPQSLFETLENLIHV